MEEKDFWEEIKDLELGDDPLVDQLRDITHPCFNCHTVHERLRNIEIFQWVKNLETRTAGDVMEAVPGLLGEFLERGGIDLPISEDELRKQVGEGLSKSLDKLDEDLAEEREELAELVENCDGAVSISTLRKNRLFGVIVCGSTVLPDHNYDTETVHITRYTND